MECRICGYALWSLTEPRCPECGTAFDFRDFTFEPDSVAFACPHCRHRHAGQGEHHHPGSDDQAVCRRCGRPMTVANMSVVPLRDDVKAVPIRLTPWERYWVSRGPWRERVREQGLLRAVVPWFGLKLDRAWLTTCWRAMLEPSEAARHVGAHSRPGTGLRFALTTSLVASGGQALIVTSLAGLAMLLLSMAGRSDAGAREWLFWTMRAGCVASAAMVGWTALVLIGGLAANRALAVMGDRRGAARLTMLAVAYGQGPFVVAAIPVFGLPVAYIWCKVSSIVQLSVLQRISLQRAAVACLWLPTLTLLAAIVLLVALAVRWIF